MESWSSFPSPWSRLLLFSDIVMCSYLVVFSLAALSHMVSMWKLRREFNMAVRSPLLAIVSGAAGLVASFVAVVHQSIRYGFTPGLDLYLVVPLMVVFSFAYIFRGCRLVAMYYPQYRHGRWGQFLGKEGKAVKLLLGLFLTAQVMAWSAVPQLGVARVAGCLAQASAFDALAILVASAVLFRKVEQAQDLSQTSKEIIHVGMFSVISLVILVCRIGADAVFPSWLHHHTVFAFVIVRFHYALWITNIKPVREALRQKALSGGGGCGGEADCRVPFLPFVPWEIKHRKVAVGMVLEVESFHARRYSSTVQGSGMGRLRRILSFPRLLEEFHTFCQKALCSESLVFLMEVLEFRRLLEINPDEDGQFSQFLSIANKFIKRDAPCEINIGSKSKAGILSFLDRDRFNGLGMDERSRIFDPAVKESAQMLADNLLDRFCATPEYKEIAVGLLFLGKQDAAELLSAMDKGRE